MITLTNAVLDPAESTAVQAPRLDNLYSQALVRILDADIAPQGGSQSDITKTNIFFDPVTLLLTTNTVTQTVYSANPTNGVYNFQKAHYRVTRDISDYWGSTPITIFVNRMGTNSAASPTIHWRVNGQYLDNVSAELINGEFPLQPGSDYATPTPPNSTGINGLVPDFNFAGGYSGSFTFPSGNGSHNPKEINFSINNNGLQQFNEDFTISLFELDKDNNELSVGMIDQTTVTILSDDNHSPAGAVDEYYNSDFGQDMIGPVNTTLPSRARMGKCSGWRCNRDNKTIIVGDFFSYNQVNQNRIVRINPDGSLDTSFSPGTGPNNGPNHVVKCIVLDAFGRSYIGGAFSSYGGALAKPHRVGLTDWRA